MMLHVLYIPARSPEAAEKIAYAIDGGRIGCSVEYLTPAEAARRAAAINITDQGHQVFEVDRVASPDGWIRVARFADKVADIAAALLLIFGGCWAVAHATLL